MNTLQDKDTTLPTSFVGRTGRFYVIRNEGLSNPLIPVKYAVRSSVDAYNNRSETPYYLDALEALTDFSHKVKIDPVSLTTNWPADKDETDIGLTPRRNVWTNRFQRAKEARTHAA
jgi:hypothetical protein